MPPMPCPACPAIPCRAMSRPPVSCPPWPAISWPAMSWPMCAAGSCLASSCPPWPPVSWPAGSCPPWPRVSCRPCGARRSGGAGRARVARTRAGQGRRPAPPRPGPRCQVDPRPRRRDLRLQHGHDPGQAVVEGPADHEHVGVGGRVRRRPPALPRVPLDRQPGRGRGGRGHDQQPGPRVGRAYARKTSGAERQRVVPPLAVRAQSPVKGGADATKGRRGDWGIWNAASLAGWARPGRRHRAGRPTRSRMPRARRRPLLAGFLPPTAR
jgi:hypothetical protein